VPSICTCILCRVRGRSVEVLEVLGEDRENLRYSRCCISSIPRKQIHLMREGERPDIGLNYLCAGNATTGVQMGEGLTRQPNEPVAYWVLAEPDAQRPTLAPGSPGFEKRQVFWYDVPGN
jgi:hypothetical protein